MRYAVAVGVLALALMIGSRPAMAFEQPKYDVQVKDGAFELRHYQPYIVAEVVVGGDQGQAIQAGFRKLAAYIFGGNQGKAKIAMTAPVAQKPQGEKIAMTAPVAQSPAAPGRWTVQFMMPSSYTLDTLPRPNDPDVRLRGEPARDMAAVSFSGVARDKAYRERSEALLRWLAARGLKPSGEAILTQYDPPFTPFFVRRNEMLVEIAR